MLDYDSEVFIWVGSSVPNDKISLVYSRAARAINAICSKGKKRVQSISISLTHQGFEPDAFKSAFTGGWIPFPKPGVDDKVIGEEAENSSDDSNDADHNSE